MAPDAPAIAARVARLLTSSWRLVERIEADHGGFWVYACEDDPRVTMTKGMPLHSPRSPQHYAFAAVPELATTSLDELATTILRHDAGGISP